ncbi:serine acetyltransferase [Aminipila butyrica]|uniref:Serine acetyltransferase n=2 Tax=Aminipila butyrica TaxID=433296 RepID=A0A858C113_9FIRM|nr:serine acetyltransferase [Aminipila butyrica]
MRLPDRNVIIQLLKELRVIMFPGYFASERMDCTLAPYFIGQRLSNLFEMLSKQIQLALVYTNNSKTPEIVEEAKDITVEFLQQLPKIQKLLLTDIQAAYDGDPAAGSKEQIIFSYPGLYAVFVYRMAHELYIRKVPFIPRIMTEYAHSRTGIDINAGASIGKYFFIDHGTGVVIGETTIIGDNVKLFQGVTIGALSTRGGQALAGVKRHPTIEDNVTIYSGASILGGETVIGHDCVIGGSAFITESIPPHTKVSMKNPELNLRGDDREA